MKTLNVGIVGYKFMGKAHSNVWMKAPLFFDMAVKPGRKNYNFFEIYGSTGSLAFDLERMNELQFFSNEDPAYAQGFRTILATEGGQHDYDANWWPPGHVIGYEHEFVHAVVEI